MFISVKSVDGGYMGDYYSLYAGNISPLKYKYINLKY